MKLKFGEEYFNLNKIKDIKSLKRKIKNIYSEDEKKILKDKLQHIAIINEEVLAIYLLLDDNFELKEFDDDDPVRVNNHKDEYTYKLNKKTKKHYKYRYTYIKGDMYFLPYAREEDNVQYALITSYLDLRERSHWDSASCVAMRFALNKLGHTIKRQEENSDVIK